MLGFGWEAIWKSQYLQRNKAGTLKIFCVIFVYHIKEEDIIAKESGKLDSHFHDFEMQAIISGSLHSKTPIPSVTYWAQSLHCDWTVTVEWLLTTAGRAGTELSMVV